MKVSYPDDWKKEANMTWKLSTDREINMEMLMNCQESQMNLNTVIIMKVENMSSPCGGCKYCQRVHSQWNGFDDKVDNVVPLSIRSVGIGFNSDEQLIERYTAEELRECN